MSAEPLTVEELAQLRAGWQKVINASPTPRVMMKSEWSRMFVTIDALLAELRKYGEHMDNCDVLTRRNQSIRCNCGWAEARKRWSL